MIRHYWSILAVSLFLAHGTTIGMQRKMWVTGITTAMIATTAATLHVHTAQSNAATSYTKQFSPTALLRLAAYGTGWQPTDDSIEPHMVIADREKTIIVNGKELTFAEIVQKRNGPYYPHYPYYTFLDLEDDGPEESPATFFLIATHLVIINEEGNFIDHGLLYMSLTPEVLRAVTENQFCYTPCYFTKKTGGITQPIGALIIGTGVTNYAVAAALHAKIREYLRDQATTPSSQLIRGLDYSTVSTDPNDYGTHQIHVSVGATGTFNKAQ
ncbi:hypothetical protein M1466_00445 [Candidatus Dependentiae bacterium]|nr:hypothetical protein [Candidatus Dependentiae bacterium]